MRSIEVLKRPKPQQIILPLYEEVPLAKDRPKSSAELLNTAGHELNHCLAALGCGIHINNLSVIPNGNYLGRTIFAGFIPVEKMQVIAAAGKVATHDGEAHGHGNDMFKVEMLAHLYNGMPAGNALSIAQALISRYPIEVRERAAEIIAYMGEVAGDKIPLILQRAQMEIPIGKGTFDYEILSKEKSDNNDKDLKRSIETDKKTIIEYLRNGDYRIVYIWGNKTEREELICNLCVGINGHKESCPRHKKEEKVIFSRN